MSLIDLIFPRNCLECGKSGQYICKKCLSEVPKSKNKSSLWTYRGVIRKAILKLKYNFAFDIADELAKLSINEIRVRKIDDSLIVPIPLHESRENWRGFNQANLLGKLISTGLGWEYEEDLLTRPLASEQQARLTRTERLRNISGKFAFNLKSNVDKNTKLILFDDVLTTGATLKEAEKTLRQSGFKNISWLTICGD